MSSARPKRRPAERCTFVLCVYRLRVELRKPSCQTSVCRRRCRLPALILRRKASTRAREADRSFAVSHYVQDIHDIALGCTAGESQKPAASACLIPSLRCSSRGNTLYWQRHETAARQTSAVSSSVRRRPPAKCRLPRKQKRTNHVPQLERFRANVDRYDSVVVWSLFWLPRFCYRPIGIGAAVGLFISLVSGARHRRA